jgi:hypothetical protein
MDTVPFSYGKRAIFLKVKEIKRLHGGVDVYAASRSRIAQWTASGCPKGEGQGWPESHASVRIDAEIGETGRFRMKTN